jgi:hypothetical protein
MKKQQAVREAETARETAALEEWLRANPRPDLPYAVRVWDLTGEPADYYQETDWISERRLNNV